MARGPAHNIAVPAKAVEVRAFLDGCRTRYLQELENVRRIVADMRAGNPLLRCIYKIYSRGDMQGGDELKHSRKVRLKFDEFNISRAKKTASLYDVPDIIGLTIVVSYPSDISLVAAAIDQAIGKRRLTVAFPPVAGADEVGAGRIVTKFGRRIESGGYFACHYNVRMPGTGPRPICELQIKTILHDAWGAKTHDLTYKPSGRTDRDLRTSFDLLGDMLANLDQQSDTLRQSIERTSTIREQKRRDVRVATLSGTVEGAIDDLADAPLKRRFKRIYDAISRMGQTTSQTDSNAALSKLLPLFENSPRATSLTICLLAVMLDRPEVFQHAQDAIDAWEDLEGDELTKLRVRCLGALAAFSAGDASDAIDIGEEIVPIVVAVLDSTHETVARRRALHLATSLYSSLGYYHADRIGSHEGEKRDSRSKCLGFLMAGMGCYGELGLPVNGLASGKEAIEGALADKILGPIAFDAYDNEAFIRIQTATSESELRDARDLLRFVHDKCPLSDRRRTTPLLEYHDYCARMRLAELEGPR